MLALLGLTLWACGDGGFTNQDQADAATSSSGEAPPVGDDDGNGDDDAASTPRDDGGSSSSSGDPGPGPTEQCPHQADADGFFTLTSPEGDYTVRLPPGHDAARPSRLFVALKGCGDNAANFATWAAVPYALRASQDYIAISVGGRDGECWEVPEDAALVSAAIEHVRSCFAVHQKQVVIGGYDSGGQLAFSMAMADANKFAGILVEHASLSSAVGASKVASTLAAAAWKLPVSIRAGINDEYYPIATMRSDVEKMQTAGFPAELFETQNEHGGETDDWEALLPKMAAWAAP